MQNLDGSQQKNVFTIIFNYRLSKINTTVIYLLILICFALTSMAFGIYLIRLPQNKVLRIYDYQNQCSKAKKCNLQFQIYQQLAPPIEIFYQIENFIENTRDYILSRSFHQLMGKQISQTEAKKCSPFKTNKQMNVTVSYTGQKLDQNNIASPCGLEAFLYFNDTFRLFRDKIEIPIDRVANITKFVKPANSQKIQWIDPTLDSFQIWMTTSINPKLQKYYGMINTNLGKGKYTIKINNLMDYSIFANNYKKNFYFFKQLNPYGDSRIMAYVFISGSILLLVLSSVISFYYYQKAKLQ